MTTTRIKLCEKCGSNQTLLKEMLEEPPEMVDGKWMESQNHALARLVIDNCRLCHREFKGEA